MALQTEQSTRLLPVQQWLELTRKSGDRAGESQALTNLGNTYVDMEEFARARECFEKGLEIDRAIHHVRNEGTALTNLGRIYFETGDYEKVEELNREALDLHRRAGNRVGEAFTLVNLGKMASKLGKPDEGRRHLDAALDLFTVMRHRRGVHTAIQAQVQWFEEFGNSREFNAFSERVVGILTEIGDPVKDELLASARNLETADRIPATSSDQDDSIESSAPTPRTTRAFGCP